MFLSLVPRTARLVFANLSRSLLNEHASSSILSDVRLRNKNFLQEVCPVNAINPSPQRSLASSLFFHVCDSPYFLSVVEIESGNPPFPRPSSFFLHVASRFYLSVTGFLASLCGCPCPLSCLFRTGQLSGCPESISCFLSAVNSNPFSL